MPNTIHTMRHPDGHVVHVNEEDVTPLARLGYHVPMTARDEDATEGYVPLDRVDEAKKAGFRFGHKTFGGKER